MATNYYEPDDINEDFPRVPRELVEALTTRFPNKLPLDNLGISDRALWVSVGEARVVQFLEELAKRTNK